jgi:hypothetical protein
MASRIGDYAMDRLGDDERREIDAHLDSCESCRALAEQARELRAILPTAGDEILLGHIQAGHLTRYAARPEDLDPRLASWIEDHLRSCDACRDAVEVLRETGPVERGPDLPTPSRSREGASLWSRLTRTVLHPAPALAYLVLLVAVIGLWVGGRGPTTPSASDIELLTPGFSLYPEERYRSEGGHEAEPVEIELGAGGDVVLRVHTEIDDRILDDETAAFRLEISGDGETVTSRRFERSGLSDLGVLSLRLRAGVLRPGPVYRIEVRLDQPGSPRHDEVLFERTFRIVLPTELS